jgi:glycosyltransferase involved in cell wall biosynthesis
VAPLTHVAGASGGRDSRTVLLVAFHFPPQTGSSGVLRALKFCRYLPQHGWKSVVLTAHPRCYDRVEPSQLGEIPPDTAVYRAFGLDTQRHLAIRGRYLRALALPDRWVTWGLAGVASGLAAMARRRIDVILTTYPIASAVLMGAMLHLITGKPWVADLRDPMTEERYPPDATTRAVYRWIERLAVRRARYLVFTTPAASRMYLARYPELRRGRPRCVVLGNGFDEADFRELRPMPSAPPNGGPLRLVHLGLLYPKERDPLPFFRALARLKTAGRLDSARTRIELRASGYDDLHAAAVRRLGIDDLVHLVPPLPYRQALQDAADADMLVLFQAASCDHQIPAKAYEYLRLGKPILALTSQTGDTAALLNETGGATVVDMADEDAIYTALPAILDSVREGRHPRPSPGLTRKFERAEQVGQLAALLDEASGSR